MQQDLKKSKQITDLGETLKQTQEITEAMQTLKGQIQVEQESLIASCDGNVEDFREADDPYERQEFILSLKSAKFEDLIKEGEFSESVLLASTVKTEVPVAPEKDSSDDDGFEFDRQVEPPSEDIDHEAGEELKQSAEDPYSRRKKLMYELQVSDQIRKFQRKQVESQKKSDVERASFAQMLLSKVTSNKPADGRFSAHRQTFGTPDKGQEDIKEDESDDLEGTVVKLPMPTIAEGHQVFTQIEESGISEIEISTGTFGKNIG